LKAIRAAVESGESISLVQEREPDLKPSFIQPISLREFKSREGIPFAGPQPFDSPEWIFETKLGGYRAITVPPLARFNRPPIYEHGRIFPLLLLMSKSP